MLYLYSFFVWFPEQGKPNNYSRHSMFECLRCAEGCDECIDSSPCIASLNWVLRTIILVLSLVVIGCLPLVVFFTWKYGHLKVITFHAVVYSVDTSKNSIYWRNIMLLLDYIFWKASSSHLFHHIYFQKS